MLGKHISEEQARILADQFQVVIFVPDQDAAGQEARKSVAKNLAHKVSTVVVDLPGRAKDVGDLSPEFARMFRLSTLNRLCRGDLG